MDNFMKNEIHHVVIVVGGFAVSVIFTFMGMAMAPNLIGQSIGVAVLLAPMLGGFFTAGFVAHFFTGTVILPLLYLLIGAQYILGPGWLRGVLFLTPLYLIEVTVVMPMI